MDGQRPLGPPNFFPDPIHGPISLQAGTVAGLALREFDIIATVEFQRLNYVRPFGLAYLFNANVTQSCFSQALGSLHALETVCQALATRGYPVDDEERLVLRAACLASHAAVASFQCEMAPLLARAGPTPSQVFEEMLRDEWADRWRRRPTPHRTKPDASPRSFLAVGLRPFRDRIRRAMRDARFAPFMAGPLSCARYDSVRRASALSGLHLSGHDDKVLRGWTRPTRTAVVDHTDFREAIIDFMDDEFRVQRDLRGYHVARIAQAMLVRLVRQAGLDPRDLYVLNDFELLELLRHGGPAGEPRIRAVAERLLERRLPKRAYQFRPSAVRLPQALRLSGSKKPKAGRRIGMDAWLELERLLGGQDKGILVTFPYDYEWESMSWGGQDGVPIQAYQDIPFAYRSSGRSVRDEPFRRDAKSLAQAYQGLETVFILCDEPEAIDTVHDQARTLFDGDPGLYDPQERRPEEAAWRVSAVLDRIVGRTGGRAARALLLLCRPEGATIPVVRVRLDVTESAARRLLKSIQKAFEGTDPRLVSTTGVKGSPAEYRFEGQAVAELKALVADKYGAFQRDLGT